MKHLFYFITIIPIMWELFVLLNPAKVGKFIDNLISMKDRSKEWSEQQILLLTLMFGYVLWLFIGVFTFQWPLFLFIFAISFIPKKIVIIRVIDSAVTLFLLVFAILNSYHFKIDLFEYIKHLFI